MRGSTGATITCKGLLEENLPVKSRILIFAYMGYLLLGNIHKIKKVLAGGKPNFFPRFPGVSAAPDYGNHANWVPPCRALKSGKMSGKNIEPYQGDSYFL